ncbi:carbohydrate ABC transporter permease [Oceanobacillus saliphilus]|uniref:carbohydrate ABC transporter permease n=1 Tax=Oceanobacillus saliphilus TaxID=2925834 RepID=UPI00201E45DB
MGRLRGTFKLLFFVGIPLIPLFVFWFFPMLVSLWLSFTNWDYISPSFDYVGIDNYTNTLTSETFYEALKNTIFFSVWTIVPTIIIGLFLALLLKEGLKGLTFFRSILFSPWITPMVAMSIVWSWIFQADVGLINQILGWFHLPQPQWLTDSDTAMWAIIIVTVWKNAGWAMLFYADSLSKIPNDLYEVSDIEGASWLQKIKTIVIPLVSPITLFLVIISAIDAIQAYDQIQVMTQGGPAGSTRTLLYLYYQMAFEQFNMGQATALATIIVLITGVLALSMFYASKKWVHY